MTINKIKKEGKSKNAPTTTTIENIKCVFTLDRVHTKCGTNVYRKRLLMKKFYFSTQFDLGRKKNVL